MKSETLLISVVVKTLDCIFCLAYVFRGETVALFPSVTSGGLFFSLTSVIFMLYVPNV